jgi:protein tyrosine phosphatase (PTP) superfamily phosphohydrolase (DUF442 family)
MGRSDIPHLPAKNLKMLIRLFLAIIISSVLAIGSSASERPESERDRLDRIERSLKTDVPNLLCLDSHFATGGQASERAFAKVAASGFRSVLSLRTPLEGVDLGKERTLVEQNGMRYFNIPVVSQAPRREQADEFLRIVKNPTHHPMLIQCATANRVGGFMMIYRVVEQGWSTNKALKEALRIGLRGDELKAFARDYIANRKSKPR